MSEHTPGPWRALAAGIDATMISSTLTSGRRVSFRVARAIDGTRETVQANARLIAAAPDMLGALRMVAAQINTIDNIANPEACNAVRAAIAKAEGRT